MTKLKVGCSYRISNNFYDYYLLKWKIKKRISLRIKTSPDPFAVELDYGFLKNHKSLFKSIFKLLKNSLLEYHRDSDKLIVYKNDRKNKIEFSRNLSAIETAEMAINLRGHVHDHDKDYFLVDVNNLKFFVRKSVSSDIYVIKENFSLEQYSFIYPLLKDGVVLDIGANIGDTAILFCSKGAKKIFAYEPHPFFFDLARRNIELNRMNDRIEARAYGVGSKDEVVILRDDSELGPTGSFGTKGSEKTRENRLNIVKFSSIIADIGDVDVVKMDCEGAEFGAILSCPPHLLRKIKAMAIEFHDDPAAIMGHLTESGFNVEIIDDAPSKYGRRGLLLARRI